MEIKYKNSLGENITRQQAEQKGEYEIEYHDSNGLKRIEHFFEDDLFAYSYYKGPSETHASILASEYGLNKNILIIEIQMFGTYRLEKEYNYNTLGVLNGKGFILYDPDNNVVGSESIDDLVTEIPEFDRTLKYYYDSSLNTEDYLFEVIFDDNGNFKEIYYNNYHIDDDGQESIVFDDSPADIAELKTLTGISDDLANYYINNRVTPATNLP